MERDVDFLGQYRNVSSKLKKRFLRKPNVAEASEQFGSLAKKLKNQECPQYAGLCCLAQARCEKTLANAPEEAQALAESARLFLDASESDIQIKCPCFEEHLTAAVNCYNHAIRVYIEHNQEALAATLCLQLGIYLREIGKSSEALGHFQRAADLQYQSPVDWLNCLGLVVSCKIETCDYHGALILLSEMQRVALERGALQAAGQTTQPFGAYNDTVKRCEITRVLLLMLLQPIRQRIKPEHTKTLEKYTWGSTDDGTDTAGYLSEELFLLLQSLMMACQSKDTDTLNILQKDLWTHISPEQNHLLYLIINEIFKS